MKKVLLLSLALLLTLTLLPTASIAALGPKPKEWAKVEFIGLDITSEVTTLNIRRAGRLVIVYGPTDLTFVETTTGLWYNATLDLNFAGLWKEGKVGIRIDKGTGEADIIYNFDRYETDPYKGWFRYQLEGSGEWSGESIPYRDITVENGAFTIYEMFYESASKKGKGKGATGVTYDPVWNGRLSFTITIDKEA